MLRIGMRTWVALVAVALLAAGAVVWAVADEPTVLHFSTPEEAQDAGFSVPVADEPVFDKEMYEQILSNPLGGEGTEITDLAEAELPYAPMAPSGLGKPLRVVVTAGGEPALRQIAWIYDHPDYGRFYVLEELATTTEDVLLEPAMGDRGCTLTAHPEGGYDMSCRLGDFRVAQIRGSVNALVSNGDNVRAVEWLEPVEITDEKAIEDFADFGDSEDLVLIVEVEGLSDEITLEELLEIAEKV